MILISRSQLREISGEMRRDYKAGRVSVDTCNHIGWTTQWVWVSVGLGRMASPHLTVC